MNIDIKGNRLDFFSLETQDFYVKYGTLFKDFFQNKSVLFDYSAGAFFELENFGHEFNEYLEILISKSLIESNDVSYIRSIQSKIFFGQIYEVMIYEPRILEVLNLVDMTTKRFKLYCSSCKVEKIMLTNGPITLGRSVCLYYIDPNGVKKSVEQWFDYYPESELLNGLLRNKSEEIQREYILSNYIFHTTDYRKCSLDVTIIF